MNQVLGKNAVVTGASGGRIAIHAMKQLQHTGGRYGLFSSCCGGGMGVSTLIERI